MKQREMKQRIEDMREALQALLDRYLELVNSGDAGYWNPETEPVVIAARASLEGTKDETIR